MKNMHLRKDAGTTPPREIIEAALKTYPTAFGYAASEAKDKLLFLESGSSKSIDEIMKLFEAGQDVPMVAYFAEITGKLNASDLQPFVLLSDKDGNPMIVCFCDGRFEDYHEDNGHSDEYNFVHTYLVPKVLQMYEMYSMHDQPMAKIDAHLQSKVFAREMNGLLGERGAITFMANTGSALTLQKGNEDVSKDTEWGWISDVYGIEYPPDTGTPEPEPVKPVNPLEARFAAAKKDNAAAKPVEKQEPPKAVPITQTAGVNVFDKGDDRMAHCIVKDAGDKKLVFPTEFICMDQNRLKHWCNSNFGSCPQGWQLWVGHPEKCPGFDLATLKDKGKLATTLKSLTDIGAAVASRDGGSAKDTQPKVVTSDMAKPSAVLEVIPANMKEAATTLLKGVDFKSEEIPDPSTKKEDQFPSFYEQFPTVTPDNVHQMDPEKLLELFKRLPDVAFKLYLTTQRERVTLRKSAKPAAAAAPVETKKVNPLEARFARK